MNRSLRLLLSSGCLVLASSCYTWQPPPPIKPGASLDSGPGESRYWNGSPDGQPAGPQAPLPGDPAAIAAPNTPPIPTTDPAAGLPPGQTPPPGTAPVTQPPVTPPQTPVAGTPPPVSSGPPYGIKVNGKPGFVYSPFDKTAGIVDVQGMAPGTKVRCPYTGKIFIVP